MRLLRTDCVTPCLVNFTNERNLPKYAILSHTWGPDGDEVTFDDFAFVETAREKPGWIKVNHAIQQARRDKLEYVWIDTCCIDKSSSAELTESINSMYRWYQKSEICYVFLEDMPDAESIDIPSGVSLEIRDVFQTFDTFIEDTPGTQLIQLHREVNTSPGLTSAWGKEYEDRFCACRWFTRGWTLQELLASSEIQFYNHSWLPIGSLAALAKTITKATGIHLEALTRKRPVSSFSIAQRMSWASQRQCTRLEDAAYSLLGIFDVSLPIIYGEGQRSFTRLQEEILRLHADHTIFGWSERDDCWSSGEFREPTTDSSSLLASSPSAFRHCGHLVRVKPVDQHKVYEVTQSTIRFELPIWTGCGGIHRAVLNCRFERSWTRNLCLILKETSTPDCYEVISEEAAARVTMMEVYSLSRSCKVRAVSIVRSPGRLVRTEDEDPDQTILCRLKIGPRTGIKRADFQVALIQLSGQDVLPAESAFESVMVDFGLNARNAEPGSFNPSGASQHDPALVNSTNIKQTSQDRTCAGIGLWRGNERYAKLFVRGRPSDSSVRFLRRGTHFEALQSLLLPDYVYIHNWVGLVARFKTHQLLYEDMNVVEIEVGRLPIVLYEIIRRSPTGLRLAVIALPAKISAWTWTMGTAFLEVVYYFPLVYPFPALVAITAPLLIRRSRQLAMQAFFGSMQALDDSELLGLRIGLSLALLISAFGCRQDVIFSVPPKWSSIVRPLLLTLTISINITTAVLSGLYAGTSRRHASLIASTGLEKSHTLYHGSWRAGVAISTLTAQMSLAFIFWRDLSKYLRLVSIGGKTSMLSMAINVTSIAVFAELVTNKISVLTPWSERDCQSKAMPANIGDFYTAVASSTSLSSEDVCNEFAFEGRLVLSILSLCVWDLIINLALTAYIGLRIFRMKLEEKWLVF